jgi:hypothetical protein
MYAARNSSGMSEHPLVAADEHVVHRRLHEPGDRAFHRGDHDREHRPDDQRRHVRAEVGQQPAVEIGAHVHAALVSTRRR